MRSSLSRRGFMQVAGLAAMGAMVSSSARAADLTRPSPDALLRVTSRTLDVKGKAAKVCGLLGPDGKPGLSLVKGGRFSVRLQNESEAPTLIHWHGLTPPWAQDGVPGVTQELLPPARFYDYGFTLARAGTNWMHAHTLQEQQLLAAPLIVREPGAADEQDVTILLHDFSFKTPEELLAGLTGGGMPMDHMPMDHTMQHHDMGQMAGMSGMGMSMPGMNMPGMDLNDIDYDAYLANDRTLDDPQVTTVEPGATVRLRIINGATSTGFTLDLGRLTGQLIAVDGMDIVPVTGRRFPLTMAQRLDLRLQLPAEQEAWPVLFLREGAPEQTGIILAARGARIAKLPSVAAGQGPVLDWTLEQQLQARDPLPARQASVTSSFDLTGSMSPYAWSMKPSGTTDAALRVKSGDRVEVTLNNHSMMAHPIHLHGHHFQVVALNGQRRAGALRDTLLIPAMASATIAFEADNPGAKWAFHCHHLYHMATGMMSFVEYTDPA